MQLCRFGNFLRFFPAEKPSKMGEFVHSQPREKIEPVSSSSFSPRHFFLLNDQSILKFPDVFGPIGMGKGLVSREVISSGNRTENTHIAPQTAGMQRMMSSRFIVDSLALSRLGLRSFNQPSCQGLSTIVFPIISNPESRFRNDMPNRDTSSSSGLTEPLTFLAWIDPIRISFKRTVAAWTVPLAISYG